jgi:sugar phosphate isomerase/epimerase
MGLGCCQLMVGGGPYCDDTAASVKAACKESGVEITEIWAGLPGPHVWDFLQGPATIGLVPPQYREERVKSLLMSADLTAKLGVSAMITHAGFIPENPTDPLYACKRR